MPPRRIAFVVNNLGMMDIIAPPAVAALAVRAGWEADHFVYNQHPRKSAAAIRDFAPDIIAYSVCSNESQDYVRINQALKRELPFFTLFGGYHATFTPDYVQEDRVDALSRGEAYVSFPQFLDRFGTDGMFDVDNFSFVMPDGSIRHNPLANLVQDVSRGIAHNGLGLPGKGGENVWETVHLSRRAKPDDAHICTFQPCPGTDPHTHDLEHGLFELEDGAFDDLYTRWTHLNVPEDSEQRLPVLHDLCFAVVDFPMGCMRTGL